MAGKGFGSTKAKVIRLTRLDECGNVVGGDCGYLISGGFTRVNAAAEYEDGDEFIVKTAWGEFCVNEKDDDRLKRMNLTIDFCQVHPDVADIAAGQDVIVDTNDQVIGWRQGEDVSVAQFALELWTKVAASADSCDDTAGGVTPWHYWLFPRVKVGRIGDLTFEYGPMTFSIDASTLPATAGWGAGPFTPAPVPPGVQVEKGDHYIYVQTTVPPPQATDGCTSLVLAAIPISGVTPGTPGAFTPANADLPDNLAALKADPVVGDTGSNAPVAAWTTGQFVILGDASQAHWDGSAWLVGAAT
jgi:hypothetical protein